MPGLKLDEEQYQKTMTPYLQSSEDHKNLHEDEEYSKESPTNDPFHKLIKQISQTLGPIRGLDTKDINHNILIDLMQSYTSSESTNHPPWARYVHSDPSRAYTRNLVSSTNPNANILLLVWNPNGSSPIHDHANAHCVMKVLRGTLQETLYHETAAGTDSTLSTLPPPSGVSASVQATAKGSTTPKELRIKKQTTYTENQVTYISDRIGVHRISNPSNVDVAISLHLYTPPHAANYGFNMFDERTGAKRHVQQGCYFSENGKRGQ